MSAISSSYKNSLKNLRKVNTYELDERKKRYTGNYYKYLSDIEDDNKNSSQIVECSELVKENKIDFNDLPEDTIYKILQFLSSNTRLAILKHKYNKKYVKCSLQKMPETIENLNKLWSCANIAYHIETTGLSPAPILLFKKEKKPELYYGYYKENFTKLILAAIRHYTRIYKFGHYTNKKVIEHIEAIMLNIFAHLNMIKR